MSKTHSIRPRLATRASLSFAIVASQFNLTYVQAMVDHAHQEINVLEPDAMISLTWVPGAFEIPLLVKLIAGQKKYNAIIALGVILQGHTAHANLIGRSVTDSLQRLSLEYTVPVIHEVLLLDNETQAVERCLGTEHNRGVEAARAAVASARTVRDILIRQTA